MTALDAEATCRAWLDTMPPMNFFQLCQLLEQRRPDMPALGTGDTPAHDAVRFCPAPGMGFPASDMFGAVSDGEGVAVPTVRLRFMGLYGVDAPLPAHFIDDIALRREGHEEVMAFLDQFNHRLAVLLYRAWRKYRYPVGYRADAADERSRDLLALVGHGLGNKARVASTTPARVLSLLGVMNQRTRTATGLADAIGLVVDGATVAVHQWHPVWVSLPRYPLGESRVGLGSGTVLGRGIRCRTRAVLVVIHPGAACTLASLLPGGAALADVLAVCRVYLGLKVDAVLRMRVRAGDLPALRLGTAAARLGWTSLLKADPDAFVSLPLGRYDALRSHPYPISSTSE